VRRPTSSFQAKIGNTPSRGGFIWLDTRAGRNRGCLSTVPPFRRTLDASSAQRARSVNDGLPGCRLVLHAGKNCPSGSTAGRRWSRIFNVMQTLGLHVSGETFIQVAVGGGAALRLAAPVRNAAPGRGPGSRHPVQCDSSSFWGSEELIGLCRSTEPCSPCSSYGSSFQLAQVVDAVPSLAHRSRPRTRSRGVVTTRAS
jgi:hypothetical protein